MSFITTVLGSAATLFAVVAALCVLTAGFFLGRAWLRRAGLEKDFNQWRADRESGVTGFVPGSDRFSRGYRERRAEAAREREPGSY